MFRKNYIYRCKSLEYENSQLRSSEVIRKDMTMRGVSSDRHIPIPIPSTAGNFDMASIGLDSHKSRVLGGVYSHTQTTVPVALPRNYSAEYGAGISLFSLASENGTHF